MDLKHIFIKHNFAPQFPLVDRGLMLVRTHVTWSLRHQAIMVDLFFFMRKLFTIGPIITTENVTSNAKLCCYYIAYVPSYSDVVNDTFYVDAHMTLVRDCVIQCGITSLCSTLLSLCNASRVPQSDVRVSRWKQLFIAYRG